MTRRFFFQVAAGLAVSAGLTGCEDDKAHVLPLKHFITVHPLVEAYAHDRAVVLAKYLGQVISVGGTITRISVNGEAASITFFNPSETLRGEFLFDSKQSVAHLKEGQSVIIKGRLGVISENFIELRECSMLHQKPA